MAHVHTCPNCGAQWECGDANYQDECAKPTRTLCLRCWSITAGGASGAKREPATAHATKRK